MILKCLPSRSIKTQPERKEAVYPIDGDFVIALHSSLQPSMIAYLQYLARLPFDRWTLPWTSCLDWSTYRNSSERDGCPHLVWHIYRTYVGCRSEEIDSTSKEYLLMSNHPSEIGSIVSGCCLSSVGTKDALARQTNSIRSKFIDIENLHIVDCKHITRRIRTRCWTFQAK